MKTFKFKLQSDSGKHNVTVYAGDYDTAKAMVLKAENCPEIAILKHTEAETMYKVVKYFKVSGRRQILGRYLTESEAQQMVKSYPDSNRSLIGYTKQFAK